MIVRHLGHTEFSKIMECFLSSFESYFVKMPTDHNYYKQRWEAAKVRYNLSYGMFDNDKLVGFIINAIDERHGEHIAFNTGTGVIPKYRGQKIVKSIYDYAIPQLKKKGITRCALEVITENHKAIKAYESVGFSIYKRLKCYSGKILRHNEEEFSLKEITFQDMDWSALPNQKLYSWDNQNRCLEKGNYSYYHVISNKEIIAFFVINRERAYVAQLDVLNQNEATWTKLFSAIKSVSSTLKINNIDDRQVEKIKAIESVGLENTLDQYEMELPFK